MSFLSSSLSPSLREGRDKEKTKKKEKKRNKKDYGDELRQKDKKRTTKKKKQENKTRQDKARSRGLTDSIIRTVCSESEQEKKSGNFIAPRISLAPLQNISLPLGESPPSPFSSGSFSPLPKPPLLGSGSDSDEEELEDICKRCEVEPKIESSAEPLRCPAPTPHAMWTGELRKPPVKAKPPRIMGELHMASALTRSISMPTLMLRKPIAVAARRSLKQQQLQQQLQQLQDGQGQLVPRLNLANIFLMDSFASRLERLHVNNGPESDRPLFQATPRSAFTETPRTPQTAHI